MAGLLGDIRSWGGETGPSASYGALFLMMLPCEDVMSGRARYNEFNLTCLTLIYPHLKKPVLANSTVFTAKQNFREGQPLIER